MPSKHMIVSIDVLMRETDMNDWRAILLSNGERHAVPCDDLRPHMLEGDWCWCNPYYDDGVWVHNAMDRREFVERKETKLV